MMLKQYNKTARAYSELFFEANQDSISTYFSHFDFSFVGKHVLDLGCGDGYDLSQVKQRGAIIYGIDASEEMVQLAKKNNPEGHICVGSFEEIPFSEETFDVVMSKWAFQNSSLIDPIYHEASRVLKQDGKFIFLASHPIRQFLEKKKKGKNYFQKEWVESVFFEGKMCETAPSHTLNEYLSPTFFRYFTIAAFEEGFDHGAEKVEGDVFPSFIIVKASRRQ